MPQKVVAQAGPLGRPLDNAGDVRHDEGLPLADPDNPKIRDQGCKVVVCNLGPRRRYHRKKGGFADIREADQPNVREQLQLERHIKLLARQAGLGETRRLTGRGCKMGVAPAAVAALCRDKGLVVRQVLDDLAGFLVAQERAARHADDQVFAVLALHALAHAVFAVRGGIFFLISEIQQGGQVVVNAEHDRAAAPAVAAVGAARSDIFLAVEADLAVAALTGNNFDFGDINKHINPPKAEK